MTTDPTITIAGLETQIGVLSEALHDANHARADLFTSATKLHAYFAAVESERDALAAQLAEVRAELAAAPKVCAIHHYEHNGPCMECGAWPHGTREWFEKMRTDLASERARLTACQAQVAGLEQATDERIKSQGEAERLKAELHRSQRDEREIREAMAAVANSLKCGHSAETVVAEVARLTARVAELEARSVLTSGWLTEAIMDTRGVPMRIARETADQVMAKIGPCVMPSFNAAQLDALLIEASAAINGGDGLAWSHKKIAEYIAAKSITALGPVMLPAQDRAEDLALAISAVTTQGVGAGDPVSVMTDICGRALAYLGAPPTSPPAARPVFAGVGEEELALEYARAVDRIPGIRAVLARLEVSLVAPVDPEAVACDYHNDRKSSGVARWLSPEMDEHRSNAAKAMRATLTAAGIPVTPEVGK